MRSNVLLQRQYQFGFSIVVPKPAYILSRTAYVFFYAHLQTFRTKRRRVPINPVHTINKTEFSLLPIVPQAVYSFALSGTTMFALLYFYFRICQLTHKIWPIPI
jgi:hypothetical protein